MHPLIEILRPHQWYKNFIIFIAILFSGNLLNIPLFEKTIFGFVVLCALYGSLYIVNDMIDIKKDRTHPEKKNRPLASGRISKRFAMISALLLLTSSLYASYLLDIHFFYACMSLLILNILYTFIFKNIFLVDIIFVSMFFVIRALAGVFLIGVEISPWLLLCTFLLALILALGKRKHEMHVLGKRITKHRKASKYYDETLLNNFIMFSLAALFISYSLYSVTKTLMFTLLTIPVSLFLLFRYAYLIFSKNAIAGSPEKVFRDRQMLAGMIIWFILVFYSLQM